MGTGPVRAVAGNWSLLAGAVWAAPRLLALPSAAPAAFGWSGLLPELAPTGRLLAACTLRAFSR
eukprot:9055857-Pyramimonas_sp.AAC.1